MPSYLIAEPEMITATATELATMASNVTAAHMIAAAPTVAVIPAAADEVSAGLAQLFSQHAANYQALAGQAVATGDQLVANLHSAAFSYADIEQFATSLLQNAIANVEDLLDTPSPLLGGLPPVLVFLAAADLPFLPIELGIGIGLLLIFVYLVQTHGFTFAPIFPLWPYMIIYGIELLSPVVRTWGRVGGHAHADARLGHCP